MQSRELPCGNDDGRRRDRQNVVFSGAWILPFAWLWTRTCRYQRLTWRQGDSAHSGSFRMRRGR